MIVDILILVVMILYGFFGYKDGMFRKIAAILGFWGGLIVATKIMHPLGKVFLDWFDLGIEASNVLAFYLVFIFIAGVEYVLVKRYAPSSDVPMGMRIGGIIFGMIHGAMLISLILIFLSVVNIPDAAQRKESKIYDAFFHVTPQFFDVTATWLPETKDFLEEMESSLGKIIKSKRL